MSSVTAFDIRYPIGGLFVVLAGLLIPYGVFVQPALPYGDVNIDFWWGLCMLGFGVALLALARAADRRHQAPASVPSSEETGDV